MAASEHHKKISELFLAACEVAPEERAAFLDRVCAGDDKLRADVEALLAQDSEHKSFLESPAGTPGGVILAATADSSPSESAPVFHLEGYEILRELHRGGQGVVYQAVQKATKRKVAIKLLLQGPHASPRAQKRFEREIALVAQLKHPNVIAIFDSGTTSTGVQYYVMDYIRGVPLHRYVRDNELPLEQTLRLFAVVCEAVQYAHYRGVIHRDLKPSNILVDSDGSPKILDFGLAKQLADPVDTVISLTQEMIGTLPYMSPEQAKGNPDHVDTRTDIYALGVMLYEILTGHYPYPVAGHMAEVLRHIAETPPTPPSRQWTPDSGVTRRSGRNVRAGRCPIDGELQTVVLKTLAKERERRYQSAGELARDIAHYLANEPIEARRDSGWYVFRKAVARHKAAFGIAFGYVLILTVSVLIGLWQYNEKVSALHRAMHLVDALEDAELSLRTGEVGEALSVVSATIKADLGSLRSEVARGPSTRAAEFVTRAVQFDSLERPTDSRIALERALELEPDNYLALCRMAFWNLMEYSNGAFKQKKSDYLVEAVKYADRAIKIKEGYAILVVKASALYNLGRHGEAEQVCRRVIEIKPDNQYADANLALILAMQDKFDEALGAAQQAVAKITKQGKPTRNDDGPWLFQAALQMYLGETEAFDSLTRALEIDNRDTRNHLMRARMHLTIPQHRDVAQALEEAKFALTFTSLRDPRYKRILALAYLRNEQYSDAVHNAQAAIEGRDEPAYDNCIAAIAEARAGNLSEARKYFDQAIDSWPEKFTKGADAIVTTENEMLWIDTRAELQSLRDEAEQLLTTAAKSDAIGRAGS